METHLNPREKKVDFLFIFGSFWRKHNTTKTTSVDSSGDQNIPLSTKSKPID